MTANKDRLGGIIHVYQKYDPVEFPSPTAEPPDLVSPAMEHLRRGVASLGGSLGGP